MLIASITAGRTGRMSDVVATIQAEQDRVIRAGLQGVLVVQGGPGTGKTVAALHRAAYLLYTHRRTLERRGVLVIGPNATFLRYISQVLPSLGETDVVLTSIAELFPGVKAAPDDDPEAAAVVKGDEKMVSVLRRAVRNLQQVPPGDLEVTADGVRDDRAAGDRRARPRPGPRAAQAAQRGPQAVRHRDARRARGGRGSRRSAASSTPTTSRTPGPGSGTSRRSAPRWTRCGRSSPRSGWSPGCWPRKVPSAAPPRVFLRPNGPRCSAPATPTRGPWRTSRCSTRPPSCSAPTTRRRSCGAAPPSGSAGPRSGTPGRCSRSPAWPRAGFRGRRHAGRLEPRPRPAAHHGRTGLGRPLLGLRPRDRGRGAGAVRDGLADGDAPDPHPVADRGRRRGAAGERGRRPLLGADARPLRPRPLARGAAHGQLPDPGRDHGGGRRRAGRCRPRRAPARVRPRRRRPAARRPRPRRGPPKSWREELAEMGARWARRPAGGDRARGADRATWPGPFPRRCPATGPRCWTRRSPC